jgi:hypothetical protein
LPVESIGVDVAAYLLSFVGVGLDESCRLVNDLAWEGKRVGRSQNSRHDVVPGHWDLPKTSLLRLLQVSFRKFMMGNRQMSKKSAEDM